MSRYQNLILKVTKSKIHFLKKEQNYTEIISESHPI